MFSKAFWQDAIERMAATGAQAVLTVLSLDGVNFIVADFDIKTAVAAFGFGALYALAKAVIALRTGKEKTASFSDAVTYKTQY